MKEIKKIEISKVRKFSISQYTIDQLFDVKSDKGSKVVTSVS